MEIVTRCLTESASGTEDPEKRKFGNNPTTRVSSISKVLEYATPADQADRPTPYSKQFKDAFETLRPELAFRETAYELQFQRYRTSALLRSDKSADAPRPERFPASIDSSRLGSC